MSPLHRRIRDQHIAGWTLIAKVTSMQLDRYLGLTIADRASLHDSVQTLLKNMYEVPGDE